MDAASAVVDAASATTMAASLAGTTTAAYGNSATTLTRITAKKTSCDNARTSGASRARPASQLKADDNLVLPASVASLRLKARLAGVYRRLALPRGVRARRQPSLPVLPAGLASRKEPPPVPRERPPCPPSCRSSSSRPMGRCLLKARVALAPARRATLSTASALPRYVVGSPRMLLTVDHRPRA